MNSLSHSSRIDFCRCQQLYYYRKILGIQVKRQMLPEPMKLGLIWDKFITSIYKGDKFKDQFWHIVDVFDLSDYGVAKLYSLIKAHRTIGIKIDRDGFIGCQHEFNCIDGECSIHGFIDLFFTNHFVEIKLSTRPDFFHKVHNITSQAATYFLSNDQLEYCIIEATRLPSLKTGYGKYSGEDSESYMNRCYQDILSRPSHYFPGFNRDEKTFGKRFWRSEFPLEEIKRDYHLITKDIQRAIKENAFYQNFMACYVPSQCVYLPICETGTVSDLIYQIKDKGGE
jgi:hypothetical protein